MQNDRKKVCPVSKANTLDSKFRRLLQNPQKLLSNHISKGAKILEFGCGPGFFTLDIAEMAGSSGEVTALDLQQGMLDIIADKIRTDEYYTRHIKLHKCSEENLGITEGGFDFVLMFYVLHELPDKTRVFQELKNLLKPGGKILVVEPFFHSSKKEFRDDITLAQNLGFKVEDGGKVFFSRTCLLVN